MKKSTNKIDEQVNFDIEYNVSGDNYKDYLIANQNKIKVANQLLKTKKKLDIKTVSKVLFRKYKLSKDATKEDINIFLSRIFLLDEYDSSKYLEEYHDVIDVITPSELNKVFNNVETNKKSVDKRIGLIGLFQVEINKLESQMNVLEKDIVKSMMGLTEISVSYLYSMIDKISLEINNLNERYFVVREKNMNNLNIFQNDHLEEEYIEFSKNDNSDNINSLLDYVIDELPDYDEVTGLKTKESVTRERVIEKEVKELKLKSEFISISDMVSVFKQELGSLEDLSSLLNDRVNQAKSSISKMNYKMDNHNYLNISERLFIKMLKVSLLVDNIKNDPIQVLDKKEKIKQQEEIFKENSQYKYRDDVFAELDKIENHKEEIYNIQDKLKSVMGRLRETKNNLYKFQYYPSIIPNYRDLLMNVELTMYHLENNFKLITDLEYGIEKEIEKTKTKVDERLE